MHSVNIGLPENQQMELYKRCAYSVAIIY